MPVYHRLDLFGMNFQPADIDDTVVAADKIITIATPFNDVAGVNESFVVGEQLARANIARRCTWRANAQGAVRNLHLHAIANVVDIGGGKTSEAVVDIKR